MSFNHTVLTVTYEFLCFFKESQFEEENQYLYVLKEMIALLKQQRQSAVHCEVCVCVSALTETNSPSLNLLFTHQ